MHQKSEFSTASDEDRSRAIDLLDLCSDTNLMQGDKQAIKGAEAQ